ncbi:MAG: hypothetical protein KBT20_06970 [Bacteroidales bacterium]|nr:hypothetical protein [Candidatus Liminaster caballi]
MNKDLTKVALRYGAIHLYARREYIDMESKATLPVLAFVARLNSMGYTVSEELLHALNADSRQTLLREITSYLRKVWLEDRNWTPLVKGWTIPNGSFNLDRYNGCPFCGTQFNTSDFVINNERHNNRRELGLFTEEDLRKKLASLLSSATPLSKTQQDSLRTLLAYYGLPKDVSIAIKENVAIVLYDLVDSGIEEETSALIKTPADILRYLWYEKTKRTQIIEPKTYIRDSKKRFRTISKQLCKNAKSEDDVKEALKLKYSRRDCLRVARWMNAIPMTAKQAAENMHPKRGMWVRMIRALRLGEYSRKKGMEHLAEILDVFYKQDYSTWQGRVDKARCENDADKTLAMLKQRPGLFARCLFSTMLRFGSAKTLAAFDEISDKLPTRLLVSLGNAAELYFDTHSDHDVTLITGRIIYLKPNKLLANFSEDELKQMARDVTDIYRSSMGRRFAAQKTDSKTIFIDPRLYSIPIDISDRTATIQDTSCALMGTRFAVEGDAVRLFLKCGTGLHAQHLDMDLSCRITFQDGETQECAFFNLTCVGAKHSGDIRYIPEMVGTAEYIELSLPELEAAKAKYVTFACNAYTDGLLSPNLVVGWMNSAYPMSVSRETGVAYDPSCVQHMVRISDANALKGLVFGVLDVAKREIIWLEMPLFGRTIKGLDTGNAEALIRKLEAKLTVGEMLDMKAKAQNLQKVATADEADESYTYAWALDPTDVTNLLFPDKVMK